MAKAHFLQDKDGNKFYPYAHSDATYHSDGNLVGDIINNLQTHVDNEQIHITQEEKEKLANIGENDYVLPSAGAELGGVKSGGDVTISNGIITINDDSHNHTIDNVDGLQSVLDEKVPTTRKVNGKALSTDITLSASDIGAETSGTASTAVSNHNTSTSAHNDIRLLISELTTKFNALADSDDTTLDQMSEIVAYIKANKELIDSVTTSKVNVSDIINNLTTNVSNKPLSAAQGVVIKGLIDALQTEVNAKAKALDLTSHIEDTSVHFSTGDRTLLNSVSNKVDKVSGKGLSTNDYTTTEKNKLSGIASNAEKNQNAFSNVTVGSTTISADTATDTLTLVAGSNVTLTPDATNDKVTIAATDTIYTHPSTHAASMITGLATVATSGKYSDLSGVPTIPTKTSQLTNDSGFKTTDNNTTYSLSKSGSTITLTGSDGSTTSVTDSNTTYTHPNSGATAGTYRSVTVNAQGHVTAGSNPTVTVAQGGTGATTAKGAEYNVLAGMGEATSDMTDSSQVTFTYASPSSTQGRLYWRKASDLWTYIQNKISSVLGLSSAGYSGNSATATTASKLSNTSAIGSTTNPVYFNASGVPVKTTYTLGASVPNDAKFTDTVYTHPSYTARTGVPTANQTPAFGGTFSVSQPVSDATGHITAINSRTITIPSATATTSANGLMSSTDKTKLDGIDTGANKTTVDSALSTTSTNPVQNKVVNSALAGKISFSGGTSLKSGDNLNNFTTPGIYISGSSSTSSSVANSPISGSGYKLTVIDGYISGRVTQFVTTNTNSIYYRQYNGTTWAAWAELFTTSNVPTLSELGITASTTELNYVDGVTSNIQTQLNNKSASNHNHNDLYLNASGDTLSGKFVLDSDGGSGIGIYVGDGSSLYLGHNNTVSPGTTLGTASTETVIRSSGKNTLYHVVNSNKYTILDANNYKDTVTPANIGAAASSHGTHVTFSTTAPVVAGTASVGSATTVARSDHKHPAQTSVTGSSGSCTGNSATATSASSSASTVTNSCLRNMQASTTDLVAGVSSLTTGAIYIVYE